jgi:hypothetical protein
MLERVSFSFTLYKKGVEVTEGTGVIFCVAGGVFDGRVGLVVK